MPLEPHDQMLGLVLGCFFCLIIKHVFVDGISSIFFLVIFFLVFCFFSPKKMFFMVFAMVFLGFH